MAVRITIQDVPVEVRDELAARAARQGKSMQEFIRAELVRLASGPSIDTWLNEVAFSELYPSPPAWNGRANSHIWIELKSKSMPSGTSKS